MKNHARNLEVVVKNATQLREKYHTSQIEMGSILLKFWSRYSKIHLEQPQLVQLKKLNRLAQV